MPFPTAKLKVLPNPWTYIDHAGQPAGRLPPDPYEDSPSAGPVGARMTDVKEIQKAQMMRVAGVDMEVGSAQHTHRFVYAKDPVSIPNTPYYRNAVKCGDLIAADSKTAALCGLKFEDPKSVLAKAKAAAIAKFDAETDEDAYKQFGSVEPLYVQDDAPATAVSVKPTPVTTTAPAQADAAKAS
jgi:hypothetical protein